MNYIVEITDDKFSELTENAEKMLRYGGKVMSCLDSIKRERFNERSPMPDYRSVHILLYSILLYSPRVIH